MLLEFIEYVITLIIVIISLGIICIVFLNYKLDGKLIRDIKYIIDVMKDKIIDDVKNGRYK